MVKDGIVRYKKILVAVDGSSTSTKAANHAIHIAKSEGAELIITHVVEDIKQGGAIGLRAKYGDVKLVEAFQKVQMESADKLISPIVESAEQVGVKTQSEILLDTGKSEAGMIAEYAEKNRVDLIVAGSRGTSKLGRLLVGSVTNKLVNLAKCPVLVVPSL